MSLSLLNLLLKEVPNLKGDFDKSSNKKLKNNEIDFKNILISILDEDLKNFNQNFENILFSSPNLLQIDLHLESNLENKVNFCISDLKNLISKPQLSIKDLDKLEKSIKFLLNILKEDEIPTNISSESILRKLKSLENFILSNIKENNNIKKSKKQISLKDNSNYPFNFENLEIFVKSFQKYFTKKIKVNLDKNQKSKTKKIDNKINLLNKISNNKKSFELTSISDIKKELINFLSNFLSVIQNIKIEFSKQNEEISKKIFNQIPQFNENDTDTHYKVKYKKNTYTKYKNLSSKKNEKENMLDINLEKTKKEKIYKEKIAPKLEENHSGSITKKEDLENLEKEKNNFLLDFSIKDKKEKEKDNKSKVFSKMDKLNNSKMNDKIAGNDMFLKKVNSFRNIQNLNSIENKNLTSLENNFSLETPEQKDEKLEKKSSLSKNKNLFPLTSSKHKNILKKESNLNIPFENLNNSINLEKSFENYISSFSQRKISLNLKLKKDTNIEKISNDKKDFQDFDFQNLERNINNKVKSSTSYNIHNFSNKSYNNQNINFESNGIVGKTNFIITETKYPNLRVLNVYQNQENLMKVRYHLATGELSLILKVENMPPLMLSLIKKEIENILDAHNLTKRRVKIKNENKENKDLRKEDNEKGLFKVI